MAFISNFFKFFIPFSSRVGSDSLISKSKKLSVGDKGTTIEELEAPDCDGNRPVRLLREPAIEREHSLRNVHGEDQVSPRAHTVHDASKCHICHTTLTLRWKNDEGKTICDACGTHGASRPISMNGILKRSLLDAGYADTNASESSSTSRSTGSDASFHMEHSPTHSPPFPYGSTTQMTAISLGSPKNVEIEADEEVRAKKRRRMSMDSMSEPPAEEPFHETVSDDGHQWDIGCFFH